MFDNLEVLLLYSYFDNMNYYIPSVDKLEHIFCVSMMILDYEKLNQVEV